MPFLSSLQFVQAAALGLLAVAPLLFLAYRKKKTVKRLYVSSVLILRALPKKQTIHRRVRPPLRAYFEFLALLLLALAAAYPWYQHEGKRIAVLLDSSLSMRARDDMTQFAQTRFSLAVADATEYLEDLPAVSLISIFTSSPRLERHGSEPEAPSLAKARLTELAPTFASDALDAQVIELAQSGSYDEVILFTDREIDDVEKDSDSASESDGSAKTIISGRLVGKPASNAYLANLSLRKGRLQAGGDELSVTSGLSGSEALQARLKVYRASADGASRTMLTESVIKLIPDSFAETLLRLPAAQSGTVYQVELSPTYSDKNAILEDDFAWLAAGSSGNLPVLLISPSTEEGSLGIESLPGLDARRLRPEEFARLSENELEAYRLLIFHQSAPAEATKVPTLLILPPHGNAMFPVLEDISGPRITSWDAEHPLTLYLRVPLLTPPAASVFSVPPWTQAIINVEPGAIAVAGERLGVRAAAFGFELLPFEGSRTPGPSVLFLNILNWLNGSSTLGESMLCGAAINLEGGMTWRVRTPSRSTEVITVPKGETRTFTLEQPGPYIVVGGNKGNRRILSANSFYPQESATGTRAPLLVPASVVHSGVEKDRGSPLWAYCIMLALLLFLLEILLHLIQREQVPV